MQNQKQNTNLTSLIKQNDLNQIQLSPNCILGGFISYIKQPAIPLGSFQLKSNVSKSLYKKTINCLYDQQRQFAFQMHYQEQLRNKASINNKLAKYMNGKTFMVDKILTPGSKVKFGQKTIIRKVNIERKYNSFICINLHALKQAEDINNYKKIIRKHFDSQHQSPMMHKLKKIIGVRNNNIQLNSRNCHTLHKSCYSLNLTPRKKQNPIINYSSSKSKYQSSATLRKTNKLSNLNQIKIR